MFSLFKKAPTEEQSMTFSKALARNAALDVTFKNGVPIFVVVVHDTGDKIKPHFENRKAMAEFISTIDDRILQEFPPDPSDYLGLPKDLLGDRSHEFREARRVVGYSNGYGIFQWRYDEKSVMHIGLMSEKI